MNKHLLPQDIITIQGKEYRITQHEGHITTSNGPALGLNEPDLGKIALNTSLDISLHSLKDTVLHECIHILDHGSQIGLKEKQVHRIASALLEMMWSNPTLAAWLCQRDWIMKEQKTATKRISSTKKKRGPRKSKTPMGFLDGVQMSTTVKEPPSNP
jgi:hypothetical protein